MVQKRRSNNDLVSPPYPAPIEKELSVIHPIIIPPAINANLDKLPLINRSAEVIWYTFLQIECQYDHKRILRRTFGYSIMVFLWLLPFCILIPILAFLVTETVIITESFMQLIINILEIIVLSVIIAGIYYASLQVLRLSK